MKSRGFRRAAAMLALLAGMITLASAQAGRLQKAGPPSPQNENPRQPALKAPGGEPEESQEARKSETGEVATIKVDTTLVTIPVVVLDRDGRYLPHLTKRNFRIYEDGIEQEIADFITVEAPFNVVLLLDTSRSTQFKLEDIQRAAIAFLEQLHPRDRVMIVSFDKDIYIDAEFTSDRARLRRAIYGTRTGGGTKLYDAVDLVITERLNRLQGRKAIVVFTDGVDTLSWLAGARSTLERVEESEILVYPIQYNTAGDLANRPDLRRGQRQPSIIDILRFPRGGKERWPFDPLVNQQFPRGDTREEYSRGARYLRALAERSGGRLHRAETLHNLSQAFSLIADELRYQYALSYYPTNVARDGSYRRIRVMTDQPNLVIRARDGYRAVGVQARDEQSGPDERTRPTLKRGRQWSNEE
jgi:Ca-activated chloride channel family protein